MTNLIMMLVGIFAVATLALWVEHTSRNSYLRGIDEGLHQSAVSLGNNISDSIEMADLVLVGLAAEISAHDGAGNLGSRLTLILRQLSQHAHDLRNLHVIGPQGQLIATTVPDADPQQTFADRAYFQFHAASTSSETLLGSPIVSRLSGERIVTISKRLNDAQGSFAGVLVAHLSVDRFNALLHQYLSAFGGASAVLVHTDGTMLAATDEFSELIGQKVTLSNPQSFGRSHTKSDVIQVSWPMDGEWRRTARFSSEHPPFSIHIGLSQQQVTQEWAAQSRTRWLISIAMLFTAVLLSLRWYSQAKLHHASVTTLSQRERELQLLADASGDLIERLSVDGVRQYVSAAAVDVLGCRPVDLVGTRVFDHLSGDERHVTTEKFVGFKRDGSEIIRVVSRYIRPDGGEAWLETTLTRLEANGVLQGFVAITRDVTRRKLRHDELDALANTDTLTGLANRRAFDTGLSLRLQSARENGTPLSLLMIDVDRFKLYNDTYGHASGDECLKAVASAIRSATRRDEVVARYGGEEFAVILERTPGDEARATAEKIRRAIAALRLPHERNLPWGYATVSIGTATIEAKAIAANSSQVLFNAADAALYRAKGSGRNRVMSEGEVEQDAKVVNA